MTEFETSALPLDRRSLLERMAWLLGVAALPVDAFAKPARRAKRFLDARHMSLLRAIADTIVPQTDTPGALTAKVPEKLDAMLITWASPERRLDLVGAMGRIDALAITQNKIGFAALTPEVRKTLLAIHDVAALKAVPRKEALAGLASFMAGPSNADPGYAKLKELIVLLYYYSQEALTTELTYEHSPGGWTPSIKVTTDTRQTGGLSLV